MTTWNKLGSPYVVTEDLLVPAGATLRVEPGTTVRFKTDINDGRGTNPFDIEVIVEGTLTARGAQGDTVVFTSDAEAARWTDWQGIVLRGKEARLDLQAVNIEYANEGIKVFDGQVTARDVTVRLCHQMGLAFLGGRGTLDNLLVTHVGNTGGTGIGVNVDRGAMVDMRRCFVVGTQNGITFSRGSGGRVEECTITLCLGRGVVARRSNPVITGSTITGNDITTNVFDLTGDGLPDLVDDSLPAAPPSLLVLFCISGLAGAAVYPTVDNVQPCVFSGHARERRRVGEGDSRIGFGGWKLEHGQRVVIKAGENRALAWGDEQDRIPRPAQHVQHQRIAVPFAE